MPDTTFFDNLAGSLGKDRVSPLYLDGIPVQDMLAALDQVEFQAGSRPNPSNRFWATPTRLQDSNPIRDIFEVSLSTSRLVNTVAFDLARFPHRAVVEYSASAGGAWLPLLDAYGQAVVIEIIESNPPVLGQSANQVLTHPQHYGSNHWVSQDLKVQPVQASRMRIVLTRPHGGNPPVNTQGTPVAYSLGVRSFVTGYEVQDRSDIPALPFREDSFTEHLPIAFTRDLLGSTVSYAERENPASNLLRGGIWRSEPQPLSYAVVNLYLDVQTYNDLDVTPNVIERFFIDPITSGCSVNLYYTNDELTQGIDDPWQYVQWTPVARDFSVRRGYMRFDPTSARYFKFEFTDLAPEPYDAIEPIVRNVRLFPAGLESRDPITLSGNDGGSGAVVNSALDGILRYEDNDRPVTAGLTDLSRGFSPTEVFYSNDPSAAARLRDLSEFYNYTPWQGGTQAPHWPGTQQHHYLQVEVLHDQRVAFYVAIAGITAFRLNQDINEDTAQYLEYFFDDLNIAENEGWFLAPQDLSTPNRSGGPWAVTSKTLSSRSNVRGVQYATTQSPPAQVLQDDDFNSGVIDPSVLDENGVQVTRWLAISAGEALPAFEINSDYNTDIGTTVIITREGTTETPPGSTVPHTWSEIGKRYSTWNGMQAAHLTYGSLEPQGTTVDQSTYGGIMNKTVVVPALGSRLYCAARVVSKIDLAEPLYVQIYDTLTNKVLAEASQQVTANQITEWDVSLDAGATGTTVTRSWGDVESLGNYSDLDNQLYFQVATQSNFVPMAVVARLVQKGMANASFSVDTLSMFEESILWEFSNDGGDTWFAAPGIRNNPDGVLVFPEPADTSDATTYQDLEDSAVTYAELQFVHYDAMEHAPRTALPAHNRLCWKVTCQRPDQHVNALAIRPWYVGTGMSVPAHEGINLAGPNQALYDHYQPIRMDPRFRVWDKPIPQSWYFFYRQFALTQHSEYVPTLLAPSTVLGDGIVVP